MLLHCEKHHCLASVGVAIADLHRVHHFSLLYVLRERGRNDLHAGGLCNPPSLSPYHHSLFIASTSHINNLTCLPEQRLWTNSNTDLIPNQHHSYAPLPPRCDLHIPADRVCRPQASILRLKRHVSSCDDLSDATLALTRHRRPKSPHRKSSSHLTYSQPVPRVMLPFLLAFCCAFLIFERLCQKYGH